jgi:clathrin heavy chain
VQLVRRLGHLPLIKEYLQAVQAADVPAVNEALNQLYIEACSSPLHISCYSRR